jgi:hypothetical protein
LFASATVATLSNLARSSTVHQLRRLLLPTGLINLAVSGSSRISQRLLGAPPRSTRKRKRFLEPAGPRWPTILCKFLIIFESLYFLREIAYHSLVGLKNGAILLLGGYDSGSYSFQTGIWQLKEEEWSRIGELSKV